MQGPVFFANGTTPAAACGSAPDRWRPHRWPRRTRAGRRSGWFEIRHPRRPAYALVARHPDGKRTAMRGFSFAPGVSPVFETNLVLSDLGEARFFVKDAQGQPLPNHKVWLQGICLNPCGCAMASTGPSGEAAGLPRPPGRSVWAAAPPSEAVHRRGERLGHRPRQRPRPARRGDAPLRRPGAISGTVLDPPRHPVHPASRRTGSRWSSLRRSSSTTAS